MTTNLDAIRDFVRLFEVAADIVNLPPQTGIYPDLLVAITFGEAKPSSRGIPGVNFR